MSLPAVNILQAMDDPDLFGRHFRDQAPWTAWRVFLAALFGLPMDDEGALLYRACTGREDAPAVPFREAWLPIGRRGGKSRILALVAVYLGTFRDWTPHLAPGEKGYITVIAADRRQARTIMNYVRAFLLETPLLAPLVEKDNAEDIELAGNIVIEVATCSYRTIRGRTIIAALCDEIAFWRTDEGSANPDAEVIAGLRPGMATVPGSMLLAASSPYARRGTLWTAYRKHHGKNGSPVLVWQAATRTMNPTLPQVVVDEATEEDPASAAAEFGGQFRSDIESFVSREVVDAATVSGRYELPPVADTHYVAFLDAAGGSGGDSMTLGVAHQDRQTETVILDAVRERRPPFSPDEVVEEFATVLKTYRIHSAKADRWGGDWVKERFKTAGITVEPAEKAKSDLYREALPLLNAGRVELLDHPRLTAQIVGLERRTARGGRDSIDHAPGQHDDLANAALPALVAAAAQTATMAPEYVVALQAAVRQVRSRRLPTLSN